MKYSMLIAMVPLVAASVVDIRTRRLPDHLLISSAAIAITGAALSDAMAGAAIGAVVFCLPLLTAHLIDPNGLGFGDVKLAAVLGVILGAFDGRFVLPALALGSTGGLVWALARRVRSLAFGPALLGGAATMVIVGGLA
jgi:leader peptidase (prepilin peptidase)/N-methyltransferase